MIEIPPRTDADIMHNEDVIPSISIKIKKTGAMGVASHIAVGDISHIGETDLPLYHGAITYCHQHHSPKHHHLGGVQ